VPEARRVVVLEADTINRFSTERILRREDYWVFLTEDPAAAARVASVSAVDLVLVDLGLDRLESIPQWQRRRGDATFHGIPPSLTDGYAVLRPLHLDPAAARFPVVTLKLNETSAETPAQCRFAVVEFLPRPWKASGLLEGLDAVFRDVVVPPAPPAAPSVRVAGPAAAAGGLPAAPARGGGAPVRGRAERGRGARRGRCRPRVPGRAQRP